MKDIVVVGSPDGDWEGVYVDGRLVFEGHSITWWHMLDALKINYTTDDADEEWLHGRGNLPDKLSDVKLATDGG